MRLLPFIAGCVVFAAHQAAAQSGCTMVSADLDQHYRGLGTAEGTETAEKLGSLDVDFILQLYADEAREAAKALDRGRDYADEDIAVLDNLTGLIDCFVGDEDRLVWINSVQMPFPERFDQDNREALLTALYAKDRTAPILRCIRGGQC
ncbi:MAG: hypothetical protein MUE52_20895 [Tabrizicola sp.]|jgi:hypothetical protein|nr:hypothetical protein [Tabrizicola sp.]